jgi:Mn-containing catalase
MADFRMNVTAESQGRLQVARLYEMTTDTGVREMLSFMLARDTMHQNQWIAAMAELERDGLETTPVPSSFPLDRELRSVAYDYYDCSPGGEAATSSWTAGPTPDGRGEFKYVETPQPLGEIPYPGQVDPRVRGTPAAPLPPSKKTQPVTTRTQPGRSSGRSASGDGGAGRARGAGGTTSRRTKT